MEAAVFISLALLLYVIACYWVATHIRYRISPNHFRITVFGVCLRKVPLSEIESVSKKRSSGWTEKWLNTFKPSHRTLVIRRNKGFRKCIMITPKNRYIFKATLEKAMESIASPSEETAENLSMETD